MKLKKNSILDLWDALRDIPVTSDQDNRTVIDEDFLGWPIGTDVEDIWHWFDEQFADFGGVAALLYESPQPERKFQVETPGGMIEVYSKHEGRDSEEDFPGVYIDIKRTPLQLAGKEVGDLACCVEYDSCSKHLQTVAYQLMQDEPTHIEVYEPLLTYGEFMAEHKNEIVDLETWYEDGSEISDTVEIPDDTLIISWSRRSGSFSVDLAMSAPACLERIPIEMVRRGLIDGVIALELNDEKELCARIGEHRFFFRCDTETPDWVKDILKYHIDNTQFEDDVRAIHESLNAEPINAPTEGEATECLYYYHILREAFAAKDALFREKRVYPLRDQVAACYKYLNWETDKPDPFGMNSEQLKTAIEELKTCVPGFSWVDQAGYAQTIPVDNSNGRLILPI